MLELTPKEIKEIVKLLDSKISDFDLNLNKIKDPYDIRYTIEQVESTLDILKFYETLSSKLLEAIKEDEGEENVD